MRLPTLRFRGKVMLGFAVVLAITVVGILALGVYPNWFQDVASKGQPRRGISSPLGIVPASARNLPEHADASQCIGLVRVRGGSNDMQVRSI